MRCATLSLMAASLVWAAIRQDASAQSLPPKSVVGQYLEVRDGPAGEYALLAWKVDQGTYNGVRLDDRAVVAAIFVERPRQARDMTNSRAVFLVDADATQPQRTALLAMARKAAGDTIREVVAVKQQKIALKIWLGCGSGYASLHSDTVKVRTRRIEDRDRAARDLPQPQPLAKASCCERAITTQYAYAGMGFDGDPVRIAHKDRASTTLGAFLFRWSDEDRKTVASANGPAIARRDPAR